MIINDSIKVNEAKVIPPHENKKTGIFGCKKGDKVVNVKTGRTGVITRDDGTSGNYDVVTIKYDDNGKEVNVKPMHDAQVSGTWQFLKK